MACRTHSPASLEPMGQAHTESFCGGTQVSFTASARGQETTQTHHGVPIRPLSGTRHLAFLSSFLEFQL